MTTRRVLVVGGRQNNIPSWARDTFDIEHVDQECGDKPFTVKHKADCIVVQVNWASHVMSGLAHELGRQWEVPVLKARDGWSSAVAHAARNKVDWFVDAVQLAGRRQKKDDPEKAVEVEEIVDNAWKNHAIQEREKAEAAEKRLAKVQAKFEKVSEAYERLRSGAEQRVIQAINRRAKELRASMSERQSHLQGELNTMADDADDFIKRLRSLERDLRLGVESGDS